MKHVKWTERLLWRFYKWRKRAIRCKYAYLIRLARREREIWLHLNGKPDWELCCRLRISAYRVAAMGEQLGLTLRDFSKEMESGATTSDARNVGTTSGVSDERSTGGSSGDGHGVE